MTNGVDNFYVFVGHLDSLLWSTCSNLSPVGRIRLSCFIFIDFSVFENILGKGNSSVSLPFWTV